MKEKSFVFTGGGSGGHSVVAFSLIESLKKKGFLKISYIGSYEGIEKKLALSHNVKYFEISTGKLRRYLSFENFKDIFKVSLGFFQSLYLFLTKLRSVDIVFATGGFVCVPVAIAAKILGKEVYLHEQTTRAGLANLIVSKFCKKVFISFESSREFFPESKTIFSGYPLRDEIFTKELKTSSFGSINFNDSRKIIFITGGGNGSKLLNEFIDKHLKLLLANFLVIHQVGKKYIDQYQNHGLENYETAEFFDGEMIDIMKRADLVIGRSGAGIVSELMALKKKSIFVPLAIAQKNEQYHNAKEALSCIDGLIVEEKNLEKFKLLESIEGLLMENKLTNKVVSLNNAYQLIWNEVLR